MSRSSSTYKSIGGVILVYYLVPILFNIILIPFGFILQEKWVIMILHMLVNTFFSPIYLLIILFPLLNVKLYSLIKYFCLNCFMSCCGVLIEYINWGAFTGYLFEPDSETIHIMKLQILTSTILFVIGLVGVCAIKKYK